MRITALSCVCALLGACELSQSDRFVVREIPTADGPTYAVFPPGPLPAGHAEVVVPDVVDPNSDKDCVEIPLTPAGAKFGLRLHPPHKAVAEQTLVVTIDETIRTKREKVQSGITEFIKTTMQRDLLGCLVEGAAPLIRDAVVDATPTKFDDVLRVAFDLDVDRRSVDVVPGQKICVQFAGGRFRLDKGGANEGRQFFGGGSEQCFRLDRNPGAGPDGADTVAFSPFLEILGGIDVGDKNKCDACEGSRSRRVAGTVDLSDTQSTHNIQRYRLFYNDGIPAFSDVKPPQNWPEIPVLVGGRCPGSIEIFKRLDKDSIGQVCAESRANNWTRHVKVAIAGLKVADPDLAEAFEKCAGPAFSEWQPVCHTFWERGIPYPQIDVVIDDEAQSVELGRTIWHVVEQGALHRYADLLADGVPEPLLWKTMARELADLRVRRRFHGRTYPVQFESYSMRALMLPLLPGDEIDR